jgi:hypothetical protein
MAKRRQKAQEEDVPENDGANDLVLGMLEEITGKETARRVAKSTPAPTAFTAPALMNTENGLRLGGFLITDTGLDIDNDVTEDEWLDFYKAVDRIQTSLSWVLGDYFVYGQNRFKMSYEVMSELTGLKPETIETYASVSRNIAKLIRVNSLSFKHHRLVAKYDSETQKAWLQAAVKNRWSVAKMKQAMEQASQTPAPELPPVADRKNLRTINRLWKAVQSGKRIDLQDVQILRRWLDEVERLARG